MKRVLLLLLFVPLIDADAYYCKSQDLVELKNIASNVSYKYEFVETDNDVSFNITLTNLSKELYFIDNSRIQTYQYSMPEQVLSGYNDGEKITYTFYAQGGYCADKALYSVHVNLPTYNSFYKDELCSDIPNYKLCKRWSNHSLTYSAFVNEVIDYIETFEEEEIPETQNDDEETFLYMALKFILEYYYIVLAVIIVAASIGIYVTNKKDNIYK